MLNDRKIIIVMPAYNAQKTLALTFDELPHGIIDEVVLVDDQSHDETPRIAKELGIEHVIVHDKNTGYGGNQKTCYRYALDLGADIVVMVHPDYQYTPRLCTAMAALIADGVYDCVLGSRILGTGARKGRMPLYKFIANRFLTLFQNICVSYKLSEYHTGYRAFSAGLLRNLPLEYNDDDFVFDNQMLLQVIYAGYDIGEITCPTRYDTDSSSIRLLPSIKYGMGVIKTTFEFVLARWHLAAIPRFSSMDRT